MEFLRSLLYLLCISIAAFFVGRLFPKNWFREDAFPFRSFGFENEGKIYESIGIKRWQNQVPDMSRIFPHLILAKKLGAAFPQQLPLMIQETCIAETVHFLLCLCGLYCIKLCPGRNGVMLAILYALGNLPYIFIQRYNRPRLVKLMSRLDKKTIAERQFG